MSRPAGLARTATRPTTSSGRMKTTIVFPWLSLASARPRSRYPASSKAQEAQTEYLYQGISARPFRRVFNLADYVHVKGASFEDGLLKIDLVREVPEAMKPRRIAINGGPTTPTIERKK